MAFGTVVLTLLFVIAATALALWVWLKMRGESLPHFYSKVMATDKADFNHVARLERDYSNVKDRCMQLEPLNENWTRFIQDALLAKVLTPSKLQRKKEELAANLRSDLETLPEIESVESIDLQLPVGNDPSSVAPTIELASYSSLSESVWMLSWKPQGWRGVLQVGGKKVIKFGVMLTICDFSLEGKLKLSFTKDMKTVNASFVEMPSVNFNIQSQLTLGKLPVPVETIVRTLFQKKVTAFFQNNLVHPASKAIVIDNSPDEELMMYEPEQPESDETLDAILKLKNTEGLWELSDEIASFLMLPGISLRDSVPSPPSGPFKERKQRKATMEMLWTSAIALAHIQMNYIEHMQTWESVSEIATRKIDEKTEQLGLTGVNLCREAKMFLVEGGNKRPSLKPIPSSPPTKSTPQPMSPVPDIAQEATLTSTPNQGEREGLLSGDGPLSTELSRSKSTVSTGSATKKFNIFASDSDE